MTQQTIPQIHLENLKDPGDILIGQSQETQIYYRPAKDRDGNNIYIPTTPLPADPWHMNYYAKKGFKLWPPGREPGAELQSGLEAKIKELEAKLVQLTGVEAESEEAQSAVESEKQILQEQAATLRTSIVAKPHAISCPVETCTFVAKTYMGLARHMKRIHETK